MIEKKNRPFSRFRDGVEATDVLLNSVPEVRDTSLFARRILLIFPIQQIIIRILINL